MEDLENAVRELVTARERVQHAVTEARHNGRDIKTEVLRWLDSAEYVAKEAENLLKHGESAKNARLLRWLPNPVVRLPIGWKLKKMTQVIQGLNEKSLDNIFHKVWYESPPIGIVSANTSAARSIKSNDVLESRASITEDILKAIIDDKVCVIGMYGPVGVGKSKLLADIERRVKQHHLFDVVAMVNVSRNPDLKRIQGEIADSLGLRLLNEETARGRAAILCRRIESDSHKNILIMLDDLRKKLDLKEVGIPCEDDNKVRGCKLLLTSRYRDCLRIDMVSDQEFRLNELDHGEARRLFERIVGDRVHDHEFKPLVDVVVKNCGGLPILIVSLANLLKRGNLAEWWNASTNIEVLDIKSVVEPNYIDLKDERTKSFFLVCALTSGRILTRCSLIYCMGLGLYKKFSKTVQNARDRFITDLHGLQDSSLLLDSDDEVQLRMNDVFVDAAISIASTEWNALVGRKDYGFKEWSKDELKKCTAISFYYVGIDELPEKLDCPALKMLLLFEDNPSLDIPDSFFESMEKLQVVDLTGLSFTSLPSSIQFLENLNSLCLDFCHLEDVTVIGKLKQLQFLSFLGSTITRLPIEIGGLIELRLLDLTGCIGLKVIEPDVLGSLVNLEELYMEDSFDRWETQDEAPRSNASLAELKNMKKLSTLFIAIPDFANLSRDLPFGRLNKHKIQIGDVWDWSTKYKESRTLKLKLDSGNLLLEEWVQRCLQRTQDLHLDGLQDDKCVYDLCVEGFQVLKHLHVQNSPSILYIVHSTKNVQCSAFMKLESIFLEKLSKLEKICHGCLALESFSKLKIVKIDNCGEIKDLFPFSIMKIFFQLEELEISRCHLMQQIVGDAKIDEEGDEIDDDLIVTSCNLRRLTLRNLPEMRSFCKTVDHPIIFFNRLQVLLPWLESLTLSELPKLKEIWNSPFSSDVSNLRFLKVEDCTSLLSIIPSNLLIKLQNLEAITIERCQLVRELFDEGLMVSGDVEILSRLTQLTLSDLPSLGHIWNKNSRRTLCFQNLMTLRVQNCENMRFLFSSSMAKALGKIKEIEITSCTLLEEIMIKEEEEPEESTTIDYLEFPLLTSLSLEDLPNLRTFSHGKHDIHYASLTRLRISRCPKMMTFSSFKGKQQPMTVDTLQQAFGSINFGLSMPVFFNQNVLFPSLKELTLMSLCQLRRIWHNELPKESFRKLASITVEDCENLSHIFPSTLLEKFQSLKMIEVVRCTSLEALIKHVALNNEKREKHLVLLGLKQVKLWHLSRLSAIVASNTKATLGLHSMTNISLHCCDNLRHLFTSDTARTLDKLEVLDVSGCNNMREVVAMKEGEEKKLKAMKFAHLHSLKLCSLKSLISFSSGSCAYEFPSLRNFSILECTKLKAFILRPLAPREEMMNEGAAAFDEGSSSLFDKKVILPKLEELRLIGIQSREFSENEMRDESICHHNLTFVRVENCPHLKTLFTISMAKALGQLQYLHLGGCGEMEYIVAGEEEKPEETADKLVIPQLITLYLHNMPKLRSFCHGKHISEWPSLKEFTVEDCKAVEVILEVANHRKLKGSIPMQQPLLLVEEVEFPSMESLKISHMDNMEKIWLDELASNAFSKLKTLIVEHCKKLSSIFSSGIILVRFRSLEKLIVTECDSLEVIFHIQEFNSIETQSTSIFQLRELVLTRLSKMKHVWTGFPQGCGLEFNSIYFGCLRCLKVVKCPSLKSLLPIPMAKTMTRLEELGVWYCGVEEIMVEEDGGVETSARDFFFPKLTTLTLVNLPKLRSFYRNSHTSTWPLLKELRVRHCGKMRSFSFAGEIQSLQGTVNSENQAVLFSLEKVIPHLEQLTFMREDVVMTQHDIFGNLRELVVDSSSFEEIFQEDAYGLGRATPCEGLTDMQKPLKALGNLKRLRLIDPFNLRRVWKNSSIMAEIIKHIESLFISWCPSLSIVFPSPTSFQRLTELKVVDCAGLVHVGTCSAVTSMAHLTWLTLRDCGAIEDVVTDDGNGAEKTSFPKLEELILDGLPSLESFSHTNCTFMFPSLVRIIVMQCPKMKIFCNGALRTPKLDKVLLSYQDDEGRWEDDLNTTVKTLSA